MMKYNVGIGKVILLAAFLCFIMCGCGKSDACTKIKLNGVEYNLADHPKDVISKMVQKGNMVYDYYSFLLYDETGNVGEESVATASSGDGIFAIPVDITPCETVPDEEMDRILCGGRSYVFGWREDQPLDIQWNNQVSHDQNVQDFFTIKLPDASVEDILDRYNELGIYSLKDLNAKCRIPGFHTQLYYNKLVLFAVYFDGEPIDIYEYMPDSFSEEKIKEYDSVKVRSWTLLAPIIGYVMDGNPQKTNVDDLPPIWRESHMLYYALRIAQAEGVMRLRDGDISEMVVVSYVPQRTIAVSVFQKDGPLHMQSEEGYYWR